MAYIFLDLSVPPLLISGTLWKEVRCTAKVVDGNNAIAGAHRHIEPVPAGRPASSPCGGGAAAFVVYKQVTSRTGQLHLLL